MPFGFSLIPRNVRFYDLFADLSQLLVRNSEATCDLLERFEDVAAKAKHISDLETEADNVTHSIYTLMNQTFLTPIDREDIAALAQRMDDVVDNMEATSTVLSRYHVTSVTPTAQAIGRIVRLQCMEIAKAIEVLRADRQLSDILVHAREINRLENEGDELFVSAMSDLVDGTTPAIEVIKWREIYNELENALDACENVSHVLEAIVLKHG